MLQILGAQPPELDPFDDTLPKALPKPQALMLLSADGVGGCDDFEAGVKLVYGAVRFGSGCSSFKNEERRGALGKPGGATALGFRGLLDLRSCSSSEEMTAVSKSEVGGSRPAALVLSNGGIELVLPLALPKG